MRGGYTTTRSIAMLFRNHSTSWDHLDKYTDQIRPEQKVDRLANRERYRSTQRCHDMRTKGPQCHNSPWPPNVEDALVHDEQRGKNEKAHQSHPQQPKASIGIADCRYPGVAVLRLVRSQSCYMANDCADR